MKDQFLAVALLLAAVLIGVVVLFELLGEPITINAQPSSWWPWSRGEVDSLALGQSEQARRRERESLLDRRLRRLFGSGSSRPARAIRAPTGVSLVSLSAADAGGRVLLRWRTASEQDIVGFQVWRSRRPDGEYARINPALVPAHTSGPGGGSYEFVDAGVWSAGVYYYRVEAVGFGNAYEWHGPVRVRVRWSDFFQLMRLHSIVG